MQQPPGYYGQQPPMYGQQPLMYGQQQPMYSQPMAPPSVMQQQSTVIVNNQQQTGYPPGACAFCGGIRSNQFTIFGILLAIICFPVGVICCFILMEKRCKNCGR